MTHDAIDSWIEKAKASEESSGNFSSAPSGVKVVKRTHTQSRGQVIMEIADKIFPALLKAFKGIRNDEGLTLQPAHIRGMALNVAQGIVSKQEQLAN